MLSICKQAGIQWKKLFHWISPGSGKGTDQVTENSNPKPKDWKNFKGVGIDNGPTPNGPNSMTLVVLTGGGKKMPPPCKSCVLSPSVDYSKKKAMTTPKFLKLVGNAESPGVLGRGPFSRCIIVGCPPLGSTAPSLTSPLKKSDGQVNDLEPVIWNLYGMQLKYLHLDHYPINSQLEFRILLTTLANKLPTLEEFVLSIAPNDPDRRFYNDEFFVELFGPLPPLKNLKRFSLDICKNGTELRLGPLFQKYLETLLGLFKNVETLTLHTNAYEFNLLGALPNPSSLRKLTLLKETAFSFSSLGEFTSLKNLWVEGDLKFPLKSRKVLLMEVTDGMKWTEMEQVDFVNVEMMDMATLKTLVRRMPNLKSLELSDGNDKVTLVDLKEICPWLGENY